MGNANAKTTKAAPTQASRDELRAKIFSSAPKSATVEDFFGTTIEIRQPSLEVALAQRHTDEENRVYFMLTDYAYVPGTDQKLFDPEDVENIKQLPFGPEFTRLIDAVNDLLGIKAQEVDEAIKEAEKSN
jgi:hypothetical protein